MRSLRPVAPALRATAPSRSTLSPRLSPAPRPCLLCAHRFPPSSPFRRHQSTATSTATATEPTDSPSDTSAPAQPPPQTHFDLFPTTLPAGPPPAGSFAIDTTALKREFLQLQARAHPDLHPAADKSRAQALSARINDAYKTLQNPLLRAQYVLGLRGEDVGGDETGKVDDAELLMEVLEARERIEEAESEAELGAMKAENEARIAESVAVLGEAFARDDVQAAKGEAVRLRYWVNIKESLDNWERGKPVVLEH